MTELDGDSILWWDIVGALGVAGYEVTQERVKLVKQMSIKENCKYSGGRIYGIIDEIALRENWEKIKELELR